MKKLWATILAIFAVEAFSEENGVKILTDDQFEKLKADFGETFATKFREDLARDGKTVDETADEENNEAIAQLQTSLDEANANLEAAQEASTQDQALIAGLNTKVENLTTSIATLSAADEGDPAKPIIPGGGTGAVDHSVALFGQVDNPMMVLEGRPYNQRAAQAMGGEMVASNSIDYSKLEADLGAYYRTRRDSTLHSFVRTLPSNDAVFPTLSGYQDQDVLANVFLDEFSQAFQDTFTAKGGYEIEPEILQMRDVKLDHKFSELKNLEKQWIGYLNQEGADAMKWSFIEFLLAETAKKLHNEREARRIRGIYIAPVTGVAGAAINASTGFLPYLKEKINNFQIKEFVLGEWTPSNIVDYVFDAAMLIPQDIRDTGELIALMSADAQIHYDKNYEVNYGQNTDYTGIEPKVKFIRSIKTIGLNNMGASKRIVFTIAGNFKNYEDKPGEMLKFNFEQEDRTLKVWSDWREGFSATLVGKKFASAALQDYEHQMIWCNDVDEPATFFIQLAADDVTPSSSVHTSLRTGVNTGATAITDIDDMAIGDTVILKCGSDDANNTTIAAAGNFSEMSAAWTPDLDDTITLFKRGAGDIIDLARTEASTSALVIAADDTSPDVAAGTSFITQDNTGATAITTLDNATVGETYIIYGGSNVDSSTIADAGEMDLTAAMTLSLGTSITLYARAADDFLELART